MIAVFPMVVPTIDVFPMVLLGFKPSKRTELVVTRVWHSGLRSLLNPHPESPDLDRELELKFCISGSGLEFRMPTFEVKIWD